MVFAVEQEAWSHPHSIDLGSIAHSSAQHGLDTLVVVAAGALARDHAPDVGLLDRWGERGNSLWILAVLDIRVSGLWMMLGSLLIDRERERERERRCIDRLALQVFLRRCQQDPAGFADASLALLHRVQLQR